MRKITDFIVNKRYFFLCVFILLAFFAFIASLHLPVNYDISKYLPDDSETKVGLSIMQKEFDENSSVLNVMFSNLPKSENDGVIDYISGIKNVGEVNYLDSTDYKDTNYTLFEVSVNAAKDSDEASDVYKAITNKYEDYEIKTQGEISDYNKPLLPIWIVILAVVCALIILVIMCGSYIEPFIFLFTILIGVGLNRGTNLIFGEISNITSSVFPILQMALSMDYSIMLANRYNRERAKTNDKVAAMKNALHDSFKAISSSSITTVVGLLALVFMQFKIGEDLGLVLAKGVLFCLISIFTCMPGILLLCDSLIQKTKKRQPRIKVAWLGSLEYKMRFLAIPIFVLIFLGCFFAKSGLGFDYSLTRINSVGQIFDLNNQIAVVYNNADEEKVANYCRSLEGHEKLKDVLCYGSTLNTELRYYELKDKFANFDVENVSADDSILRLVYYNYYNGNDDISVRLGSLINFIETEIYPNENFSKNISEETKANLAELSTFIKPEFYNSNYSSTELAEKFSIDESLVQDLLVYYNAKYIDIKLTPSQFISFIKNDVAKSKYANNIDSAVLSNLNSVEKYTDINTVTRAMSYSEMASFLGVSSNESKEVYLYYILINTFHTRPSLTNFIAILKNPSLLSEKYCVYKKKLTPKEFILFILSHKDDRIMKNRIDSTMIGNLNTLNSMIDNVTSGRTYSATEISQSFGVEEQKVKLLYSLYDIKNNHKNMTINLREFISLLVNDVANNPEYSSQISRDDLAKLHFLQTLINNEVNGKAYTAGEIYQTLSGFSSELDQNQIDLVYLYYGSINNFDDNSTMTIEKFVNYLNDSILSDSRFDNYINEDLRNTISEAKKTVDDGKNQLIGEHYSRFVLNTEYPVESEETFAFVAKAESELKEAGVNEFYIIGNSPMSYEISQTFNDELNFITILTIIFIFIVVLITFRSFSVPVVLVSLIQCAVFLAMGIMTLLDGSVYFIALLIVQSILMGATIDYAILYTSYYIEHRKIYDKKQALIKSYEKSLGAILTSALIVMLVTLVVGYFTSDAAAKICIALSQGAFCSLILVVFLLPSLLSALDRFVTHQNRNHN